MLNGDGSLIIKVMEPSSGADERLVMACLRPHLLLAERWPVLLIGGVAENQGVDYPAELLRIRVCSAEQVAQLRGRFRSVDVSLGNWNPLPAY